MYVCVYVDSGEGGQGSWRARWMNGRKGGVLLTSIACVVRSFVGLAAGLGGGAVVSGKTVTKRRVYLGDIFSAPHRLVV